MKSLAALLLLCSLASAQPMMVDPSKMSGMPRPDPQVPAGTITVRLIRGSLDKRMVGVDVTLGPLITLIIFKPGKRGLNDPRLKPPASILLAMPVGFDCHAQVAQDAAHSHADEDDPPDECLICNRAIGSCLLDRRK